MTFTRVLHITALFLMQGSQGTWDLHKYCPVELAGEQLPHLSDCTMVGLKIIAMSNCPLYKEGNLTSGDFPGAGNEIITLKEGENLSLHCTLSSDNSSARQWLNPRGFAIFLNTQQALRDQRYKLVRYSEDELSIQLSNVTVHDEGVYKCFYYGIPFKSKNKTVEILAPPSNPVLKVSQDTERSITLSCYTQGCKPQPQITWLLDNGIELSGDTKHKLEADGKKWTTTSTLTVLAYGPSSTASCIVHHQALRREKLMATFWFEDLTKTVTTLNPSPPAPEVNTRVSKYKQSTLTATVSDLNSSMASAPSYAQHDGSKQSIIPSVVVEDPVVTSSASAPTQENLQPDITSTWTETSFDGNGTKEELSSTEAPLPSENVTVSSINFVSEGIRKKESNLLLPILVAALILVLLIIVLLFVKKLKKAHGVWKRDNDVSEQTLESYKSKSIEDSPGHEKNGHVVTQKSSMQYVTEGHMETTQKNPRDKNIAISEKLFGYGKETDV